MIHRNRCVVSLEETFQQVVERRGDKGKGSDEGQAGREEKAAEDAVQAPRPHVFRESRFGDETDVEDVIDRLEVRLEDERDDRHDFDGRYALHAAHHAPELLQVLFRLADFLLDRLLPLDREFLRLYLSRLLLLCRELRGLFRSRGRRTDSFGFRGFLWSFFLCRFLHPLRVREGFHGPHHLLLSSPFMHLLRLLRLGVRACGELEENRALGRGRRTFSLTVTALSGSKSRRRRETWGQRSRLRSGSIRHAGSLARALGVIPSEGLSLRVIPTAVRPSDGRT